MAILADTSMTHTNRNQQKISSAWLMGILFCGALFAGGCHKVYITDDEVHQQIKSGLPPSSTYYQVTDFLKKQNWGGKTELLEFKDWGGSLENMLTEEEKRNIKWFSTGSIRQTEKTLLKGTGITIGFFYDKEEKLVTYKLHSYRYFLF
jgi:hypothetical protein